MREKKEAVTTTVARINGTDIVVIENGTKLVPVKTICEAIGVSFEPQFTRLKNDPIMGSTITLSVTVAADGKVREMACIPFKYVFGWLFQIDSRNVKAEAREAVLHYQDECYNALYNHFTRHAEFIEWQSRLIEEQLLVVEERQRIFHETKEVLIEAKEELNRRRRLTLNDFIAENAQLKINFEEV